MTFDARGYPLSDVPDEATRYSQARARDDIKSVIENDGIFEFSDDKGEYGIVGSAIASIEFIDSKGDKKAGF